VLENIDNGNLCRSYYNNYRNGKNYKATAFLVDELRR
jgi:hypothetical protein